jgi:hypothetical protein
LGIARLWGHGSAQCRVAAQHESGGTPLEGAPIEKDVASATLASEPDVGAETVDEPVVAAARVRSPQTNDVAEHELDDAPVSGGHWTRHGVGGRTRAA